MTSETSQTSEPDKPVPVDLTKLDLRLGDIGWTRERMFEATDIVIGDPMAQTDKLLIWRIIQSKQARALWSMARAVFPEARIVAIYEAESRR